jgi:hypothetical protein
VNAKTIQPFLQQLHQILGDSGFVKFFVDDGNLAATFDKMVEAIQYIKEYGPMFGYTVSPHLSENLVRQFSNMQKIILKSILGCDHMDELVWIQAQFAIKDGGLGLNHLDKVRHAAYVSSILGCREEWLYLTR